MRVVEATEAVDIETDGSGDGNQPLAALVKTMLKGTKST